MSEEVYRNAYIKVQRDRHRLMEQNKRYREALEYVMKAESSHYDNLENTLEDFKTVISFSLEESE